MTLISKISTSIKKHSSNNCFCINNTSYKYKQLAQKISNIRFVIKENSKKNQLNFGLATFDDIETYASILALWLEGKSYVPFNPAYAIARNEFILNEAKIDVILTSNELIEYKSGFNTIVTNDLVTKEINLEPNIIEYKEENLAYILFTSGSTGVPKGVPITFNNLSHLIKNIEQDPDHKIYPEDKCLQMFDLTFDFSIVTFLFPLLYGASVYTIPEKQIKYLYIYKLLVRHNLTYLIMVPSIIHYLKPYFEEINATSVRYCCFGAAPLNIDVLTKWKNSIPNAKLFNSYGPTEFTVTTSYYSFQKNISHKTRNGVVSLGLPLKNVTAIIIDDNLNILPPEKEGELCLAGSQLTNGYLNNKEKNDLSFFKINYKNKTTRFYKTGDLCVIDKDGYLIFIGRKDFQVKIRGYRVELSEIEYHAKVKSQNTTNLVAVDIVNNLGNTELALAIESSENFDTKPMLDYMKTKMPDYMIPMHIKFIKEFPHNSNGKIDRKLIKTYFKLN